MNPQLGASIPIYQRTESLSTRAAGHTSQKLGLPETKQPTITYRGARSGDLEQVHACTHSHMPLCIQVSVCAHMTHVHTPHI